MVVLPCCLLLWVTLDLLWEMILAQCTQSTRAKESIDALVLRCWTASCSCGHAGMIASQRVDFRISRRHLHSQWVLSMPFCRRTCSGMPTFGSMAGEHVWNAAGVEPPVCEALGCNECGVVQTSPHTVKVFVFRRRPRLSIKCCWTDPFIAWPSVHLVIVGALSCVSGQ